MTADRRGWRERLEPGIYRAHRLSCESSTDHRSGRRCSCPLTVVLATGSRRSTWATVAGGLPEARRARARAVADVGKVSAVADSPVAPITLEEFARDWLERESAVQRPASIDIYRNAYEKRIEPALGTVELAAISHERLSAWLADLDRRDSHRRAVEQALDTLRVMLTTAVGYGRISENPAARLRLLKRSTLDADEVRRVLNEQQIERMLTAAGSTRAETMLRTAVEVGLRKGEIIGLRWSDVDLEARRIRVARSVWQGKARRVEHSPKSGRARTVAISPQLATQLSRLYATQVIGQGDDASGPVWPGRDGAPMGRSTPGALLARVLKRAGMDGACSFHGLRHTAASRAFARGVPILVISRQLGHSSTIVTSQVYAHLLDESQLDAFADAMAPIVAPSLRDALREGEAVTDTA